ncbi:SIMPL domain-containing protein [Sinomonas susongensis]|uniref:SIMPL domain-containing protein n=1 Tax=Sinomonas susongensis TaxID=1324851 RepID=UPI0014865753|nr:SIMPL domain-containing protein [Sinomonas susongensis]
MVHKPDIVSTTGVGVVRTAPDAAVLRLSVEVREPGLAQAYAGASAAARRVVDSIVEHGVARPDLSTGGLSVRSETVWRETSGQQVVAYVASSELTVTVRELGRAPELLDAVVRSAGDSLRLHGLSFEVGDRSGLQAAAQEAAFDDARAAAERLARMAGRTLGPVLRIDAAAFSPPGTPVPLARAALASSVEPMPIEAGETTVSASVSVVWRLSPAPRREHEGNGHSA